MMLLVALPQLAIRPKRVGWFVGSFQRLSAFLSACYFQSLLAIARNGFTEPVATCSKQTLTIIRNSVGFNSNDT